MVWAILLPFAMWNRRDWNVNSSRQAMHAMHVDCDCGNVFSMIAFVPVMDCAAYDVFDWMMMIVRTPVSVSKTMMWSNHRFR